MKITFGAVLLVIVVLAILFFFLRTKTGKRLKLRASGTAAEAISKDASTPEGAKAYYNVAIEKKEEDLAKANVIYTQMLGKISNYEDQIRGYKKDLMKTEININSCVEKNDDEGAKVYLKEQQDLEEKVAIIKDALTGLKENAKLQEETVKGIRTQLSDLKAEKDNAVLTLETVQVTKSLQATTGVSSAEEDKMLEKVRDGIKKQKEAADGVKVAYENSTAVQKQRLDQKMKNEEIEKKLTELKAKKK
jgi:phage shock protein A